VSKAVGHVTTKITERYIHHSTVARNKLKRKNPINIMKEKIKKIKREEI
jgi:hypothetical protein